MTQEELDALMEAEAGKSKEDSSNDNNDLLDEGDDNILDELFDADNTTEDSTKDEESEELAIDEINDDLALDDELLSESENETEKIEEVESTSDETLVEEEIKEDGYRADANTEWPPPPPTEDHQVVNQLDDVARDSEIKAEEIFDKLENITNVVLNLEHSITEQKKIIERNIEIFQKLSTKFPDISTFNEMIEENQKALDRVEEVVQNSSEISNDVMMAMDVMQYQDIHRQKIERVINVMRTLSHYMHSLFDSPIEDSHRTTSAVSIASDNMMSNDEIETLLETLGK